ncbi:hypothetical protein GCM10020218_045510 [Dactylosporangium vinaceum]
MWRARGDTALAARPYLGDALLDVPQGQRRHPNPPSDVCTRSTAGTGGALCARAGREFLANGYFNATPGRRAAPFAPYLERPRFDEAAHSTTAALIVGSSPRATGRSAG